MLLRTRIVLIFGAGMLAMLAAVVAPLYVVEGLTAQALADARQEAQAQAWAAALSDAATPFDILASQIAAGPALATAVRNGDAGAARRLLAEAQTQAGARIERVDVMAAEGRLLASSAGIAVDAPLIDTANLRARLQDDPFLQGIEAGPNDKLLIVVTSAFDAAHVISVAAPAEPVLRSFARGERGLFLLDRNGDLLLATAADDWPALSAARTGAGGRPVQLDKDGRTLSAVSTPLLNTAGLQIATLVSMRDVTEAAQRRTLVLMGAGGGAALVFAILLLALYAFTKGALDPLSEITRVIRAMAAGDALVSADIPDRQDEVGAIAGAVEVFRRDIVALARTKLTERMRQAQQQALIRHEMEKLAGMLEPAEQDDLMADLSGIEAAGSEGGTALAEGFRRMAARVMAQHTKLAGLLAERTRDLDTVRQALAERAQLSRLREELEVARHLQLSSLPQVFPPFPDRTDFEIYAAMEPAKEVGGDFYDFALLDGDRLTLMVGDASGKGVSAAMFIAMGRSILRSAIVRGASPGQALGLANSTLAVENHTMMFATVFVGVLDLKTGWMTFATAGHNPPYLVTQGDAATGAVTALAGSGIALGIMEDAVYDDEELQVPAGASLVLFTDGVTEANAPDMSMYGEARLEAALAALASAGPEGTVHGIQAAVRRFADGMEQADDITVLSARFLGPSPDARPTAATVAARLSARPEV
jgi:sigma-B regulation protein RsbU (phosphoserine phosphatase)